LGTHHVIRICPQLVRHFHHAHQTGIHANQAHLLPRLLLCFPKRLLKFSIVEEVQRGIIKRDSEALLRSADRTRLPILQLHHFQNRGEEKGRRQASIATEGAHLILTRLELNPTISRKGIDIIFHS
jgi:hypothetical protein